MRLRFNRHKTFSTVLNVIGLTLAFSVFLILTVQVVYDTRYDLNYPDTDKIVRLEYSDPTSPGVYGVQLSRPFIEHLKTFFPQAEAGPYPATGTTRTATAVRSRRPIPRHRASCCGTPRPTSTCFGYSRSNS